MVFAFSEVKTIFFNAMKRILHYFCLVAAFAGMVTGAGSCDISTRQHRGDNYDPEYPDDPTRPGEGVEESRDITLKYGYGEYYGQWYNNNSDSYLIYLYEGATDSEGNFTGSAHMLTLDVLLPKTGELAIREGFYNCTDAAGQTQIFIPAYESKDENGEEYLDGSTLYIQKDPKHYAEYGITDGELIVKKTVTNLYDITARVVANGAEYNLHFKGAIDIEDKTQGGQPEDIPKDVEMKNISRVVALDCGQVWDGIECTDYRDWILYFYDKDADATSEYTCVEILTEEKVKGSLPDMKLTKVVQVGNPQDFVPGVIIGGYTEEDNSAWGTWYCKGGYAYYAATKGTLDIKRSGSDYTMTFDFVDEDETYGGTFKGSYTGPVEFKVDSGASNSARRSAGKFFGPRRGAAAAAHAPVRRSNRTMLKAK